MADQDVEPPALESKIFSALEDMGFNPKNEAAGFSEDISQGGNPNLVIDGISDDEDEAIAQPQKNGNVKTNGHPAKLPEDKGVIVEDEPEQASFGNESDNQVNDGEVTGAVPTGEGIAPKKKKKKSKAKSKRGKVQPTGFEEYYVDAPVTPAIFQEEKGLYDASLPFSERIEIAIQRYVAKRNLDSTRKDLFDKYLAYGGIEAGTNPFGGVGQKDMKNMDAAEVARMKARHFVAADKDNVSDPHFVVDFEACAAAFLSSRLPVIYDLTSLQQIKSYTTIIFNFLNYLLHHDVCVDHTSQIYASRTLCILAEKELWQIVQAQTMLPGDFNTACSEIFGGILRGLYTTGDEEWSQGVDMQRGISPETARKVFKIGLAARAGKDIFERYKAQSESKSIKISSVTDVGFEVTEIIPATTQVLNIYAHKLAKGLQPLGLLRAKSWRNPTGDDEDLTEEEEAAAANAHQEAKDYEFWVEDHILDKCFVGMKLETTVTELSFGVSYFDAVFGVYCSFHRVLPNAMMYGWREAGPRLPMREKAKAARWDEAGEKEDDGDGDGGNAGVEGDALDEAGNGASDVKGA